jgi:phosphoserine phosphatase
MMQPVPFDKATLERATSGQGRIFVDFDHTLLASNSTELFLAHCRPSWLAALVDFFVREFIPWRLLGIGDSYCFRDYLACVILLIVSPWNFWLWRNKAPALFETYKSADIAAFLSSVAIGRVTIVTFGMTFVVRALVAAQYPLVEVVGTPILKGIFCLRRGKVEILRRMYDATAFKTAIAISDSRDDLDLLSAVGDGFLINQQGPIYRARERVYLPYRYTMRAKYPAGYALDQLILVDFSILLVATSSNRAGPGILHRAISGVSA